MGESFSKKENKKKKARKKQDKALKMEERKSNNSKGKGLEEMMAYIDEDGNITSTPPSGRKKEINAQDIRLGAAPVEPEDTRRTGVVSFFGEKGYGFIRDDETSENIFVHSNDLVHPVQERDRVTFERVRTPRGYNATEVRKAE